MPGPLIIGSIHHVAQPAGAARAAVAGRGRRADRSTVVRLLNAALATEIACVLRSRHHHAVSERLNGAGVETEFLRRASQERQHVDALASRIVQLGGAPEFSPDELFSRRRAEGAAEVPLVDLLREALVLKRSAIDSYADTVRWMGDADPATHRMLEGILESEKEHAGELASLLVRFGGL